jgi:hypothetical protein
LPSNRCVKKHSTTALAREQLCGHITSQATREQFRVSVEISEKLLAEAGESSGTQRKENVRSWKPLPSNG